MTTTASPLPDIAVPPGAVPDLWTEAGVRDVYSQIGHVAVSPDLLKCPAVTVLAEQRRDGSIGCIDVLLDVEMGRSDAGLSTAQARELAALLLAAADTAESWATTVITTAVGADCSTCEHWDSCPRHPKAATR